MHKYGFVISAMMLTTVPMGADARKLFIGICEGVVQLGFFIDGKVSAPVGRARGRQSKQTLDNERSECSPRIRRAKLCHALCWNEEEIQKNAERRAAILASLK